MAREKIFRFRLDDDEDRRFRQLAAARGVDRADLIRESLGLDVDDSTPASNGDKPANKPDPKKEPGAAGISELADRMEKTRSKKRGKS